MKRLKTKVICGSEDDKVIHFVHWGKSGITAIVTDLCTSLSHAFLLFEEASDFDEYYSSIRNKHCAEGNVFKALMLLYKLKLDIIHVHSFSPLMLSVVFGFRAKLIFHLHSEYPYLYEKDIKSKVKRLLLKQVFRLFDIRVISVSAKAARLFQSITGKKCTVVPNGVADKGSIRSDFRVEPDGHRIYSVCRLSREKNLGYAIDLVEKISSLNPEPRVVYDIYGTGVLHDELDGYIKQKKLEDIIKLKGFCDNPEFLSSNYDYYLSASDFEGFPLSVVSAMRGKNIVLMTPVGELTNHIVDGIHGFYLNADLTDDSCTIMKCFELSDEIKSNVQRDARRQFVEKFTIELMISKLKPYYSV